MTLFKWSVEAGVVVAMLAMAVVPATVRGEFFVDLYGGVARTKSGEFSAHENREIEIPGGDLTSQGDLSGAESNGVGLRGGYWDKNLSWIGAALDLNHFGADSKSSDAEVRLTSLSFMLMLRYPVMVSEEYPGGRFHPYAGIGVSKSSVEISAPSSGASGDVTSDVGGVFCSGIKWMVTPKFGLFAEYRFVSISFDDSDVDASHDLFGHSHTRVFEAEGDVQAQQFLGGVSFHF
ncbi:MAG: porin family protein [Kiritimatiellales bacterium]|nr:porin family protein [Kiritimatiellales bacterium]MCF7863574.1 porin family protein [Kiritimatiellales bacterium]